MASFYVAVSIQDGPIVAANEDGEVIALAHGVPRRWIDTAQSAELWAICMALLSVAFPDAVYTDCNTVRMCLSKGPAWAGSGKLRYARVWRPLCLTP